MKVRQIRNVKLNSKVEAAVILTSREKHASNVLARIALYTNMTSSAESQKKLNPEKQTSFRAALEVFKKKKEKRESTCSSQR